MCKGHHGFLYLIWQDPRSRRNYTVGKLSKGDTFVFEYYGEYEEARKAGWDYLKAFPEQKRYESPTLFAAFASRLPDPKRRGIEGILQKYGLSEYDGYELLRESTGRLPIDTYAFIDPILPEDEEVEREFYVAGVRHSSECLGRDCGGRPPVNNGDELTLLREPENEHDEFAVRMLASSGELVGYVPRYYSKGISDRLDRKMPYSCKIIGIDREHNCGTCLKVRLSIPGM